MLATRPWRPPDAQRVLAAHLVWLLSPIAQSVGAFASAELTVTVGGVRRCPDVALARGEPPVDGRLGRPPELIVVLGGDAPRAWLAAGSRVVWRLEPDAVIEYSRGGTRRAGDGVLRVPGVPGARIPVGALLAAPWLEARRVPDALR